MKAVRNNTSNDLKDFLDSRVERYNQLSFIENDPISIPHMFSSEDNIAISGFLTAIISWGQRKQIIKNATQLMALLDNDPYGFIQSCGKKDLARFSHYYYRTFNNQDCIYFIKRLHDLYASGENLQILFEGQFRKTSSIKDTITGFRELFFRDIDPQRTGKHLSNPSKGSSAKRLNMFLRWMVRQDDKGVDFGIWKAIPMSELRIPLDIHAGNVARKFGLLKRTINDWNAVEELTGVLRQFDDEDPVKYDFALFGLGVNEEF
jgi:uncharacterized protein (TIGR02757 family)